MAYDPNVRPPQGPVRPAQRGGIGWAWIIVIIVVAVILWFAFAGGSHRNTMASPPATNGNGSGAATNTDSGQANQNGQGQVTDPGQLSQGNAGDLVGKPVQLQNATVADVAASGAFLIDAGGKQVLVVPATTSGTGLAGDSQSAAAAQKGSEVSIQGTIEKFPGEHDAMHRFQLSSDEAARAGNSGIYINASTVTPVRK